MSTDRIGTQISAKISGIVSSGLFVRLDDGVTEGFIHRKSLPDDYYDITDSGMSFHGKSAGWKFTIGMEIEATLLSVDIASGGLNLRWFAGGEQNLHPHHTKSRRKNPARPKKGRKARSRR